jgi:hypothetical protein
MVRSSPDFAFSRGSLAGTGQIIMNPIEPASNIFLVAMQQGTVVVNHCLFEPQFHRLHPVLPYQNFSISVSSFSAMGQ